jgi:taurine dioxygenase
MFDSQDLTTTPISPILGSEILGVTVAQLVQPESAGLVSKVRKLLDERLVLLLPQQVVTPRDYIAFAELFGTLPDVGYKLHVPGEERIKLVSNGRSPEGKPIGAGDAAELMWHADDTYRLAPPSFMYLHAQKVPQANRPKTSWISMYEIHDKLDAKVRDGLKGLCAIHAAIGQNDVKYHRDGLMPSVEARSQGSPHPLLRAHPESGRKAVFMPRRRDALIIGRTPEESAMIIEPLWDHVTTMDHGCSIALGVGDLVIWDNRFTLHAREAWDQSEERTMWRLANLGERPVPLERLAG